MTAAGEPAIKSYFFGKGYRDLRATIAESWQRNRTSAREHLAASRKSWSADEKPMALIWLSAGISVLLFGTVFFLAASVVHVVVLAAFFFAIYLGFSLVYLAERGYLAWKGFFSVCPACHSKRPLPEYFCSRCGEVHRRLIPSDYGILHHTCRCGERLPATFFLQRGKLQARCPECQVLLDRAHTETHKAFIPVVGGPAAGKSAFLFAATRGLVERVAPSSGLTPQFLDAAMEGNFQRIWRGADQGIAPEKTGAKLPHAYNLKLSRARGTPRLLYFYDPAGEAFDSAEELVLHKYQEYLSGVIFLVDPFSLPEVREQYSDALRSEAATIKPSALPAEDALSRVLINLEQNFGLATTARVAAPLAVVVSKADACDLARSLGEAAVDARLRAAPPGADRSEIRHHLVREQLLRWGEAGLVDQFERRFAKVRFFACSALGRSPDGSGSPFVPWGVLEPLLWLLELADPGLRITKTAT
jgi:Double-GTPase 2